MITNKQRDDLRQIIGEYTDALNELHAAEPIAKSTAAYRLVSIDGKLDRYIDSLVDPMDGHFKK